MSANQRTELVPNARWNSVAGAGFPSIGFSADAGVAIVRRLDQEPGEPEAFKDSFETLFLERRGEQRDRLLVADGEMDIASALNQSSEQGWGSTTLCRKIETASFAR